MSVCIQSGVSSTYLNTSARYLQGQVTLSGSSDSLTSAVSSSGTGNIAGKLNALENSSSTNARPMFLKGVIKQLTGVKVRGVEIDSLQLDRSTFDLDASQSSLQLTDDSASYSSESLSLCGKSMSLDIDGSVTTKSGETLGFDLQIDSGKVSAAYSAISCQSSSVSTDAPQSTECKQLTESFVQLDVTA